MVGKKKVFRIIYWPWWSKPRVSNWSLLCFNFAIHYWSIYIGIKLFGRGFDFDIGWMQPQLTEEEKASIDKVVGNG